MPPAGFGVPNPSDELAADEDPYEVGDEFLPEDEEEEMPLEDDE